MTTLLSLLTIALLSILAISAIIFTDVYPTLKLKSKEQVDIDIVKFNKCILPYKEKK